ncbi:MAG: TIGR00282 family metallophosphoesterase [Spirochaetales bacterium]|jgi:metallophosphoesterase (TIGR00282 family)|nr:TIGR00282 family metallophosphoesterase [Exilispira sp.]NMC67222.1 TIGR00282 family metallophosphoesterase [Spirochaetales bacterium]
MLKILVFGDVVGEVGRNALSYFINKNKEKLQPDLIIANGENASGGIGISPKNADDLFSMGVDVITSGNHIWKHKEIIKYFDKNENIIRPLNYGDNAPGKGWVLFSRNGKKFLIMNLLGQVFMDPLFPPIFSFECLYEKEKHVFEVADCIILDFHAEATAEKVAISYYLKDRINLIFGSHTHVQTADETLLSEKTAYITDIGMTGPSNSVIGMEIDIIIEKFKTMIPKSFKVASGDAIINGIFFTFDESNKKVIGIERIFEKVPDQKLKESKNIELK